MPPIIEPANERRAPMSENTLTLRGSAGAPFSPI
jgi:hypothetical protein